MKIMKNLQIISFIIFYILLILLAYQVIMKVTGHSPTMETLLATAMGVIIAVLFNMNSEFREFMGEVRIFMKTTERQMDRLNRPR